ncbi:MAG: hypothetical protein LQ341_003726 [Variospora aurantia]|nr:MAG: hypothetical protein LQ341_003726 [Variospora aurantia]
MTTVTVLVTPTITHCSLATVIGLGVRVRLEQALPPRFRVDVRIKEGTHSTAEQVNRQLGDKERVAAALENGTLMGVLRKMEKEKRFQRGAREHLGGLQIFFGRGRYGLQA